MAIAQYASIYVLSRRNQAASGLRKYPGMAKMAIRRILVWMCDPQGWLGGVCRGIKGRKFERADSLANSRLAVPDHDD